ncbi:fizzy-related protein homolog [Cryptotermes secundus]|uniref:fizzy-related protein homolog n=1 Tax=Cryptotermes secundus TaxID=105785 RepID=UPI000CD7C35B|nr:fizzy-related protein homolog [Cryptotermes secundus]
MMNSAYERRLLRKHTGNLGSSGSLEARLLTAALPPSGGFLESSSDVSPVMAPPTKKRHILLTSETPRYRKIGDRFIPTRNRNNWLTKFATVTDGHSVLTRKATENGRWNCDGSPYSCLLRNELLGAGIEDVKDQYDERGALVPLNGRNLFKVRQLHIGIYS